MARVVDLTGENVTRQRRKERTYGTKTDLASTVVERGSTHWAEGSNVNIDGFLGVAGTMTVSGTLSVTGTFNASGSINLSGSTSVTGPLVITGTTTIGGNTNITGEMNVTGPTTLDGILDIGGDTTITGTFAVDGPTTISGTLDIEGNTTVASDFEIVSGGLFKSGVTKIEPNGKATFGSFIIDPASPRLIQAPGGWLFSNGADSIGLAGSSTSSVNLNSDRAELDYGGKTSVVARAGAIDLNAPKTWVNGQIEVTGTARFSGANVYLPTALSATTQKANLYVAPDGRIFKSSAV